MKKLVIASAVMVMALAGLADKVTLMSGSVLTGDADVIRDGKLTFKTADLGDLVIPIEKIASLESARDHIVQYVDNNVVTKPLTVANGVLVERDGNSTKPFSTDDVKATDPEIETWHGSINASGTIARGNTVAETATIVADVARRWEKDRLTANLGYYFSQNGDSKATKEKTVSRFELQGQEDHFWTSAFYSYVNGKYEFDRIMDLKYRYRLGLGLGYQMFENRDFGCGKMSFNQELGATYIFERYDSLDRDSYGTLRYAHHFLWNLLALEGLDFMHNFEILPQMDDWSGNYLIDADVGFTYAFRKNWQFIAKAEWDYKKQVGENTKHSDIRYILGVGYKW